MSGLELWACLLLSRGFARVAWRFPEGADCGGILKDTVPEWLGGGDSHRGFPSHRNLSKSTALSTTAIPSASRRRFCS